jgi:hypothetical protein
MPQTANDKLAAKDMSSGKDNLSAKDILSAKNILSAKDILQDIHFEIAQGIIAQNSLRESIEAVRQFQNKARLETFKTLKPADPKREIISRQYQIVDMLLTLLYETALELQSTQQAVKELNRVPVLFYPSNETIPEQQPEQAQELLPPASEVTSPVSTQPSTLGLSHKAGTVSDAELDYALRPDALHIEYQTRSVRWPLLGGLLTRLKYIYQRPALFFSNMLADRQTGINQVLGERLRSLETVVRTQNEQIEALTRQISELQKPHEKT